MNEAASTSNDPNLDRDDVSESGRVPLAQAAPGTRGGSGAVCAVGAGGSGARPVCGLDDPVQGGPGGRQPRGASQVRMPIRL